MSRALLILAAAAVLSTGLSTRAEATTIDLANIVSTPTTLAADVVVNGLNEELGAFAFQLLYNPADLTGNTYINDPDNKVGDGTNPIVDFSGGFDCAGCLGGPIPGVLDVFVLSGFTLLADATAAQGPFPASFVLTHVLFDRSSSTAGIGLQLDNASLSNFDGTATIPLGTNPVPEPTTMLLLGTGLGVFVMTRRKQRKSGL